MQHRFYLAPAGAKVGLTTISLGLVRALDRRGIRVGFFKPISQPASGDTGPDRSSHFLETVMGCKTAVPIPKPEAERALRQNRIQDLLERIVGNYRKVYHESDVLIIEGLVPTATGSFASQLNPAIVKALSAQVILVSSLASGDLTELTNQIEFAASQFGGVNSREVIGCVVNKAHVNARGDFEPVPASIVAENDGSSDSPPLAVGDAAAGLRRVLSERCSCFRNPTFDLIGAVPWNASLPAKRLSDVAEALKAEILHKGDMDQRRVQSIALCARTIPYMLHVLKPATLLVTPPDRQDIIIAAAMAAMNKVPLAGLLLVGEYRPDPKVFEFIRAALETGLPILYVNSQSYHTATALFQMSDEVPLDDVERVDRVMEFTASHIDADWLLAYCKTSFEQRMSPAAFRYQLVEKARQKRRRIILPEGEETRTIEAAVQCQTRGIADCILMGDPETIQHNAHAGGLELPAELTLMNPLNLRYRYVEPLMEFRKHKKLAFDQAEVLLKDNVVLGTVMLALGEVDGLVSGAVHSTANTIRPALQIIKTREEAKVVSSVFFMCLPEHVLVYGDCAIVPDPDAETLADIAIQSAESAERFGIPARVAMISYSTGESGSGTDVDKVRKATERVKQIRPGIVIDGPLQYDAASTPDVAAKKAPNSPVAGKATVFVFPDLNTGNTTYKAVQRSANVVSIGPMLQGLKKPVNDLSRGALVEDIIYTIALTAVQAGD